MTEPTTCPRCGVSYLADGVRGACPRCLATLAFALEEDPEAEGEGQSPEAKSSRDVAGVSAVERDIPIVPLASVQHPVSGLEHPVTRFGEYDLFEEIARGGMGVVFKARQRSLNRVVALKLLLSGPFASREVIERFRAEALAAAKLKHPNIVPVYDVGEANGQPFISMEFVAGRNLAEVVRDQPLPARQAADYVKTIAAAVQHAHEQGILHRDLKPSNVLLDGFGQPRVTDFGLAKRFTAGSGYSILDTGFTGGKRPAGLNHPASSIQHPVSSIQDLTLTGQVLGSPSFVAPEQAGGHRERIGPPSDVYSLGALLYHLLTGRPPFQAASIEATLHEVMQREPVSPKLLNASLPRDLETICLKCLEKEPRQRYATARELAEELGRFLESEPIRARPIGRAAKGWRWCRRKPALAAAIAALLLVGTAGLAGILWQWRRAEANADAATQQGQRAELHAANETAQRVRAEEAVMMLELQRAEDLLDKDEVVMGVAYLARMVRQQPTNQIASRRLMSVLTQRNFALPVGPPLQHEKRVWHAEFSPDGRFVATASLDFTARIWDARTAQPLRTLQHPGPVRAARFSPDGARLMTVADDSLARLWDANTGVAMGQPIPIAHKSRVDGAHFSPDGRKLLSLSDGNAARVWDLQTGEPLSRPLQHQGPVIWARFTPDGRRIITASEDKTARTWDAQTGDPVGAPLRHPEMVQFADLSPDGERLVTAIRGTSTFVWEIASGKLLSQPKVHASHLGLIGFSPEGERIVTETGAGIIQVWNAGDWSPLPKPMMHRHNATTACFSPDGKSVLTASLDGTARLWDSASGEPLSAPLEHDDLVWSARFSPEGAFAVTASADQTARIWDVRPGPTRTQAVPDPTRHLVVSAHVKEDFSLDGDWAVNAWNRDTVRLWNTRTFQPGVSFSNAGFAMLMRLSPDGARLATCSYDGVTQIWDARTGREIARPRDQPGAVFGLKFSPDGQWLAGVIRDRTLLHQWNVMTGAPRCEPLLHQAPLEFFCYSPDGQRLMTSDFKDDVVWLYEAATGRLLARTPEREGRVMHADFSADGRRLITASEDGTARIWDGHTLQPLTKPLRHKGTVTWAKFSHDGRLVVTGSEYGTARVWEAHTGEPIGEPMNHRAAVSTAEFSPDDRLIVTASHYGRVRLWDAQTGRPVSELLACANGHTVTRFSGDGRRVLILAANEGPCVWDVPPATFSYSRRREEALARSEFRSPNSDLAVSPVRSAAANGEGEAQSILLADLAEAVIGKRVNAQGEIEDAAAAGLARIRQRAASLPRDLEFTCWLEWFFADRSTRTISPYSPITVPEYVTRLMENRTLPAAREAVLLAPTRAPALAHLAEMILAAPGSNAPVAQAEAAFLLRRAESLARPRR